MQLKAGMLTFHSSDMKSYFECSTFDLNSYLLFECFVTSAWSNQRYGASNTRVLLVVLSS